MTYCIDCDTHYSAAVTNPIEHDEDRCFGLESCNSSEYPPRTTHVQVCMADTSGDELPGTTNTENAGDASNADK